MTHSFSSISTFEKCPRHYEAQYILKTVRFTGSDATREGERIHKALEKYIDGSSDEPPRRVPSDGLHEVLRALYGRLEAGRGLEAGDIDRELRMGAAVDPAIADTPTIP